MSGDLRLTPLTLDTLDLAIELIPLRNNSEVQVHLRNPGLVTVGGQRRWCRQLSLDGAPLRMFAVRRDTGLNPEIGEDYETIGCVGLTGIDWQSRRAELSVYTVPSTYELEAARLILRHAFRVLGLHRVEAETLTERRFTLCADLGFSCEGSRRHAYWRDSFVDTTRWGLLADDCSEAVLR